VRAGSGNTISAADCPTTAFCAVTGGFVQHA
jgi:hypothetical protein